MNFLTPKLPTMLIDVPKRAFWVRIASLLPFMFDDMCSGPVQY